MAARPSSRAWDRRPSTSFRRRRSGACSRAPAPSAVPRRAARRVGRARGRSRLLRGVSRDPVSIRLGDFHNGESAGSGCSDAQSMPALPTRPSLRAAARSSGTTISAREKLTSIAPRFIFENIAALNSPRRVGRQRRGDDDDVGAADQVGQLVGQADVFDKRRALAARGAGRDHGHAELVRQPGDLGAGAAEADDHHRGALERLGRARRPHRAEGARLALPHATSALRASAKMKPNGVLGQAVVLHLLAVGQQDLPVLISVAAAHWSVPPDDE